LRSSFVQHIGHLPIDNTTGNASIISDELTSLPIRINAGLMVLSACKSRDAEVTSEGLLGLGGALLQGGASATISTVWEVADLSNKALIAGNCLCKTQKVIMF
jgi:CHAT domain-containing protein